MNVIYKELNTFSFAYMLREMWYLVSTCSFALLRYCWDALSIFDNATVWIILSYTGEELHNISCQGKCEGSWLIIYTSYLDVWDVRRDRIFDKRQSTIDIDTCMTWYLFIMCHFITLTWSRFPIHPQTRCTMPPDIQDIINWYEILFYIY